MRNAVQMLHKWVRAHVYDANMSAFLTKKFKIVQRVQRDCESRDMRLSQRTSDAHAHVFACVFEC